MSGRANSSLVLSIWLIIVASFGLTEGERWSRQVSNSDWIPLANPGSQQAPSNLARSQILPPLPQIHQPLIPSSLPPELRQEYQQQLIQLQKTQESIQRLLMLQQELKAQQQLLQGQSFLPNGIAEGEENKQQPLRQGSNAQVLPDISSDVLVPPPQLSSEVRLPIYTSQNFQESQVDTTGQEQYEDYNDRQVENYRNAERTRESLKNKEKYVNEGPSGSSSIDESADHGEEEVQVVYVPAEILAQRGQLKNHRGRERKQYGNQDTRLHNQQQQQQQHRPFVNQRGESNQESTFQEREKIPTTISPQEDAYARDFLQQLQREQEGTDRLLKEARQKELDRLREERKEIQRRAKLQQAALEREQEIQRQREAEKKRKELAKLEETAKQRELERIRESREKQRQEEVERAKKAQARVKEEKRKQEEARQVEIERLSVLERQKKAEIERTIKAQKELERVQKEDEESARKGEESPQAEPLIRNQHNHQQHQTGKYNRHNRNRNNKFRQRQHNVNTENVNSFEQNSHETTTTAPLSPNQPPLAVYMINVDGDTRILRISDVLKTLKDAKTIDVLDNVGQEAPRVFVGPSNLQVPSNYAKFDLPYLSSIENNRVERRVDKLPFFVAPLSFNPPPGYSKIPFPAPHIGSVVVNTLDEHIPPTQSEVESYEDVGKANLNPLIEPNSFSDGSNQGISYSTTYDSPTTSSFAKYRQEEPSSTPQYQSTASYSSVEASGPGRSYKYRQHFSGEQSGSQISQEQSQSRPNFQEESNRASQYSDETSGSTTPIYRQPNVVTSFAYQENPRSVSSTPVYQDSYSQVREDSTVRHQNSQLVSGNHDLPEHREVVHRYQEENNPRQEYSNGQVDSGVNSYEDTLRGPTQYNLPAELPPIIPQLPGLVNSLIDEREQATFVDKQISTTSTTTTTTTEAPRTTHRSRGRHRGRVIATRPSTTTTTTLSPPARSRDTEKTRRPVARSRSRYTTTTEEYRDTYEPTRSKVLETTQRYNSQENYKRPSTIKTQKFKSRDSEGNVQNSRNQVHNVQAHEAEINDSNAKLPQTTGVYSNEPIYQEFNFAPTGLENYPATNAEDRRPIHSNGEEYSKNLNYPQGQSSPVGDLRNEDERIGQQYREEFPASEYRDSNLELNPVNGFNYQMRNEHAKATSNIPPTSGDYSFYQNKENFHVSQDSMIPTDAPINSQIQDYQRPTVYHKSQDTERTDDITRLKPQFPINEEKTLNYGTNDGTIYHSYSKDNQDNIRNPELTPQEAPLEITTEITSTTSTTTEATPGVIRQRVRGRFGSRGRPDSHIQTKPRGSQDEYVRFSAINNQNNPTTERPTTRHRESSRPRPKTRNQYQGSVQIQTEGNDYVRIQAPVRTYQKTIVTPSSTTQRTTTTPNPITSTVRYEEASNDELEYGFIRPPNFNPVHPMENRHENFYRPNDNQAQLQSIVPTDETAQDSSLSHTQVARNRPKYQSPNRRPSNKPAITTTPATDVSSYTEKPRNRVEEPKNNRLRVRGRKPGRRRTTTTTTTTTEYVQEDINDLPIEENYPRRTAIIQDTNNDGQGLDEEKFEALPLAPRASTVQQQNEDNSYTSPDFVLNFGTESASPEPDQMQMANQPSRKYGQSFGSRSRTHSIHRGSQDRDIHGAESQWSTKLTSNSFQPSSLANRLSQDEEKSSRVSENEKNKYINDQASPDAPEIITAPPEDSYVTVLLTSDDKQAKSVNDDTMEASSMEGTNYGMKTSVESRNGTPASNIQDTEVTISSLVTKNSTESVVDSEIESSNVNATDIKEPTKKIGTRRRRVRVRVRPASSDDFVTAESQHFNSAINSLLQDRLKYNNFNEESKELSTTLQPLLELQKSSILEKPENMLDDFLNEMFKGENQSTVETTTAKENEDVTKTVKILELDGRQEDQETSTDNGNVETTIETLENNSDSSNDVNLNEYSTNSSITKSMNVTEKSWDSTKRYIDSIAMQSGEYLANLKYPENGAFDENLMGRGNEVSQNDNRNKIAAESSSSEIDSEENYPKNHRSEWSEVRYPFDKSFYNHSRKINLTGKQLPGVVTKFEGDTNVKTLSDYVKAIFDTMKNADEEKNEGDAETTTKTNIRDTENISSIIDHSTNTEETNEMDLTTVSSIPKFSTLTALFSEINEKSEATGGSDSIEPGKRGVVNKIEKFAKFHELLEKNENPNGQNEENSTSLLNEDSTEFPQLSVTAETTKNIESSTDISNQDFISTNPTVNYDFTETLATDLPDNSNFLKSDDISMTNSTENSAIAKLTGVLRTSTSTKVSHMTEICYRGRCVMTKPKKDYRSR